MPLAEPTTAITDFILAALSFYFADRLFADAHERGQKSARLLAAALGAAGVSALLGGLEHGFWPHDPATGGLRPHAVITASWAPVVARVLWIVTLVLTGAAALFLELSIFTATLARPWRQLASIFAFGQLIAFILAVARSPVFLLAAADYGVALLITAALVGYAWSRRRIGYEPWMLGAVAISFAGAAVQISGLTLHRHFNHNDLFHVLQMVGLYLIFQAGLRLTDAGAPAQIAPRIKIGS